MQVLYSPSSETSYRKISQSLEPARLDFKLFCRSEILLRSLDSTAREPLVKV